MEQYPNREEASKPWGWSSKTRRSAALVEEYDRRQGLTERRETWRSSS
jgi:hypothetical protein